MLHIAVVISSHGYGHAARAAAVMSAVHQRNPGVCFEIITLVPEWFFAESLPGVAYRYFPFESDIGVVQVTPLSEDLPATVERLKSFLPFNNQRVDFLANYLRQTDCSAVLCDIAPAGIAAAQSARIPSVLIENFTWDWIYAGYLDQENRLGVFLQPLKEMFLASSYRVQTMPVCEPTADADITVFPVARQPRHTREQTRQALGIDARQPVVLITMGGIVQDLRHLQTNTSAGEVVYIIPGGSDMEQREENLIRLPHHHGYFHPDLVHACDLVVGKLGYSTIAEAYHAGVPYLYIPRNHFRETRPLADFVETELAGAPLPEADFFDGSWVNRIAPMLAQAMPKQERRNGADQIADFLQENLIAR